MKMRNVETIVTIAHTSFSVKPLIDLIYNTFSSRRQVSREIQPYKEKKYILPDFRHPFEGINGMSKIQAKKCPSISRQIFTVSVINR